MVEHYLHTVGVAGSKPASRTIFLREIDEFQSSDTILTQNPPEKGDEQVTKWPVKVKHRNKVYARIYRPCEGRDSYRVSWQAAGQRQMKSFKTYSGKEGARAFADELVGGLAKQSPISNLTAAQAEDALAAFTVLNKFREETGQHISLVSAASIYCGNKKRLKDRTIDEAVSGFLQNVASVQDIDIGVAVKEFLTDHDHLTHSKDGSRSQISKKYAYNRSIQLSRFASSLPGHLVSDLTKAHLDNFINTLAEQKLKRGGKRKIVSAKSRNHYRTVLRQFLSWCVRKDYLPVNHRLFEADAMRQELANTSAVEYYSPEKFKKLMDSAKGGLANLLPLVAIGGFAGLRTAELLRLDWSDVWRVADHIEVTAGKAKTRQRRLVVTCPALANVIESFRKKKSGPLWNGKEVEFQKSFNQLCKKAKVQRKHNGLRHSFCTYHFAKDANENLTAAQAGNSPAMIHSHYKGLATKADAEKWFNAMPVTG